MTADTPKPEKEENDRTKLVKGKPDPNGAQRRASDPAASVWVTASAGTGKTKVLTDRVLRLMLEGAAPDQILCLTFTRAAASVMTNRIREELSAWATCEDAALEAKLKQLTGAKPDPAVTRRARQLFAEFLDAAGGMRVQTIHSFSQSLLRRFPIESGIPPYFDVMDDQTAAEMLREAQADVLRQVQREPDSKLAKAVRMVTPEVSEDDFSALIGELTYRRGQLFSVFEKQGGIEGTINGVYGYLNAPAGTDTQRMMESLNADAGLNGRAPDIAGLKAAADILTAGSAADIERAKMIKAWILHPEQRAELFWDYASVFLTADKDMRKRLTTKATQGAQDALEKEAQRLLAGIEDISAMNVARGTESILRLTGAVLEKYTEKKRALNLLDYDDLVYHANLMMTGENAAGWALQKLPGNLSHILVDEAQDTNPDQWQLVTAIATEFFKTKRQKNDKGGTLFVVGDEKQSIFSFQRAEPREFAERKKIFADMVKAAGGTWREVELDIAFRSSPAVTRAVDAVFADAEASDGLFSKEDTGKKQVRHDPFRRGQAGLVEVHPVLRGEPPAQDAPWSLPLKMEAGADPAAALADKIADQIKEWLDKKEQLPSRNRAINPADILILVRRRSAFVDHMVRALKKRDIPVAGADRMSLREQIAVMDLVALGETLLFPKDDYKLACVLKSPLIGMSDKQLEDLAVGRAGDLWDALGAKAQDAAADKIYKSAFDYLAGLQAKLNAERPYEFYSSVLMNGCPGDAHAGLNAMYGRLGFEAEDPLVEFMNAAERFERAHVPSLQGFLAWLDAGEAEVKRELNLNPETPRVHIMTVHGAKGLEAPVVILPDTTGVPEDNSRARPKFLWPDADRPVPLWVPRADLESQAFVRERKQAELERDREFRRLLYVAMTRAADRLYVYGYQNGDKLQDKSWYALIRKGLHKHLGDEIKHVADAAAKPANDDKTAASAAFDKAAGGKKKEQQEDEVQDDGAAIVRFGVRQTARPKHDGVQPVGKTRVVGIPAWARTPPDALAQEPVGKFRPSEYKASNDNYSAPSPLDAAKEGYLRQLGTVIHELFEFLPSLPPEERESAAKKHLAKPVWKLSEADQAMAAKQVMAILNDPEFGALFGPNSRAEVSITGLFEQDGKRQMMSGQIDRLVVDEKSVLVVDFKNSRKVPKTQGEVEYKYIVQLAAYRLALQEIYPDKDVKCALLYTREAKLLPIASAKLDAALNKINLKPAPRDDKAADKNTDKNTDKAAKKHAPKGP